MYTIYMSMRRRYERPTLCRFQDIALLDLDAMKTFERAQFVEHQNIRRVEAAKALESSMEKVGEEMAERKCVHASVETPGD